MTVSTRPLTRLLYCLFNPWITDWVQNEPELGFFLQQFPVIYTCKLTILPNLLLFSEVCFTQNYRYAASILLSGKLFWFSPTGPPRTHVSFIFSTVKGKETDCKCCQCPEGCARIIRGQDKSNNQQQLQVIIKIRTYFVHNSVLNIFLFSKILSV